MFEWNVKREEKEQGPIPSKKLAVLAEDGKLRTTDLIRLASDNEWAEVRFMADLIPGAPPTSLVKVTWPGKWMILDGKVPISFDGRHIDNGSFKKGFTFAIDTVPGQHVIGVKVPFRAEKPYHVEVQPWKAYVFTLAYDSTWGTFTDAFGWAECPATARANWAWTTAKETSTCRHCGTVWAVSFLGEKQGGTEYHPETMGQYEHHEMQNPNFLKPMPLPGRPIDIRPTLEAHTTRQTQVQVAHVTWHKFYECTHCGKKWKEKEVRKHIP